MPKNNEAQPRKRLVFKGFIPSSLVDWDGRIVSVLYVSGCNFRCPFCHNSSLVLKPDEVDTIPWDTIKAHLTGHKDFLDGACITGGEPTLHRDLPETMREIRALGMGIKLDTNGTNPDMLASMMDEGLLDFVSMDIKAPLDRRYSEVAGVDVDLDKIRESIGLLMEGSVGYEFRTTVLPRFHNVRIMEELVAAIEGAEIYAIQNFVPRNTLNPDFEKEKPFSIDELEELAKVARPHFKTVLVRGI
ncbi:MAG: anaerobic ribonucleoside-triphosphate reductase activating protein [Thermoplasmata archaeon]|nr:anaerobic ribonucleoside-triphosphate reductase activating protein [Thermoplasmata archaeon]